MTELTRNKPREAKGEPAPCRMADLVDRIQKREEQIDEAAQKAIDAAAHTVKLAIEQGYDLLLAKHDVNHGDWLAWLQKNFPKTPRRATDYMVLAAAHQKKGDEFFAAARTIEGAFRLLGLLPEVPQPKQIDMPQIAIPPIIQKLNSVAEWFAKESDEIKTWPKDRLSDLKQKLRPVVELWQKL